MKLVIVAVVLAVSAATAAAQSGSPRPPPTCDVDAVERERAALDRERQRARTWNTTWAITYAGLAGVQVAAAMLEFSPGNEFTDASRDSLYIGAGKAVIGSLSRIVLPLRVPHVGRSADPCADVPALRHARSKAARKERNTFILQLGGGALLHVIGGGYLVLEHDAWREAGISLALGAAISAITLYTEPKTSWRHPHGQLGVVAMPTRGGAGVAIAGSF